MENLNSPKHTSIVEPHLASTEQNTAICLDYKP